MTSLNFDATQVEPQQAFELLPAGTYVAQVVDSEIVDTKSGTGQMLKLTWSICEGEFVNRKLFGRINIANTSAEAERIGRAQLSALCHAAGVLRLQDSTELHMRPVRIKVKVREDKTGQYEPQNEISGYLPLDGKPAAPTARPAAAPAPAKSSAPWMR